IFFFGSILSRLVCVRYVATRGVSRLKGEQNEQWCNPDGCTICVCERVCVCVCVCVCEVAQTCRGRCETSFAGAAGSFGVPLSPTSGIASDQQQANKSHTPPR